MKSLDLKSVTIAVHCVGYLNIVDWRVNIYCVWVGDCKSPCYKCLAAMCVGKCNPQLAVLCKLITAVLWFMVIKGYHVSVTCKEVECWFQNHCEVCVTWSWCSFYYKYSVGLVAQADVYIVFPPNTLRWKLHHVKMQLHGLAIPTRIFSVGTGLDWLLDTGTPHPHPPKAFFYVANKIFVTCSVEAHNISLTNCGITTILIFNVIFPQILNLTVLGILGSHLVCPYWLTAPDSLFLLWWHMLQKVQLMDL